MLGPNAADVTMWYIPTAVIYEGCNERQARQMGEQIRSQFGIGKVAYLDPEHLRGDALREKLEQAGKIGVSLSPPVL